MKCNRFIKILLIVSLLIILYNETFVYYINTLFWPTIKECQPPKCYKILLVADPQIIGEQNEFFGELARWDSDRYLTKNYDRVMAHSQPHLVIFLGDIMDEGNIATNEEFDRYVSRLKYIFPRNKHITYIFIPGDNDIGGESEPIFPHIVKRFTKTFPHFDVIPFHKLEFYMLNKLMYHIPKRLEMETNRTRITLSHLPLLFTASPFVKEVVDTLDPSLCFSAHHHKAAFIRFRVPDLEEEVFQEITPQWQHKMEVSCPHDTFCELMVPTCSYRMGVKDMAFVLVNLEPYNPNLTFYMLWLPSRFFYIFIYLGLLIVIILSIVIKLNCIILNFVKVRYLRRTCQKLSIF